MSTCYKSLLQESRKCAANTENKLIPLTNYSNSSKYLIKKEFSENISGMYKDELIGNTSNKTYSTAHKNNTEAHLREEVVTMDDNKILEKYLDKVDQDRREMEQRLTEDRRESEKRIEEQRRLSEERIEKKFNDIIGVVEKTNVKIDSKIDSLSEKVDSKIDSLSEKVDSKIDSLSEKVDSKIDSLSEKVDSKNKWIVGVCITTILSIAGMAISIILTR